MQTSTPCWSVKDKVWLTEWHNTTGGLHHCYSSYFITNNTKRTQQQLTYILWQQLCISTLFLFFLSHLNTYLMLLSTWPFPSVTLPCTLIFCHVFSWLHSWTPVLQPGFSSLCLFNYVFLPSSRTEPVSQPVYSFITSWTSTQVPLLFPSHGFLVLQLWFFPLPLLSLKRSYSQADNNRMSLNNQHPYSTMHWLWKEQAEPGSFHRLTHVTECKGSLVKKSDPWHTWGIMLPFLVLSDCQSMAQLLLEGAN